MKLRRTIIVKSLVAHPSSKTVQKSVAVHRLRNTALDNDDDDNFYFILYICVIKSGIYDKTMETCTLKCFLMFPYSENGNNNMQMIEPIDWIRFMSNFKCDL